MKKIFISSTFKDMQSERDVLHERVLPMINEKLKELGETALGIDLRWGISTEKMSEEEAELKAFSVCFDEIDDSRPYFIAFLGERYGYPVKKEIIDKIIPALKFGDDFKQMQKVLSEKEKDRSITELEIRYGCFLNKIPKDHFLFFFRNELDLSNANEETKDTYLGNASSSGLKELKKAIIEEFSEEALVQYSATVNKEGELDISDEEIKRIEDALYKMLVGDTKVAKDFFDLLQEQVDKRAEDKHQFYFGRENEFATLNNFLSDKNSQIMLVSGKSGSGKTTFLTEAYYRNKNNSDVFVYVPIAMDNSLDDDFGIIAYINRCLFKKTNIQAFKLKRDEQSEENFIDDFSRGVHEFATKYNGAKKIVLMLDAVDRLYASKAVATLSFLTTIILNKYPFKTIVSTATDADKMQVVLDIANTSYVSIDQVSDEEVLSIVNLKFKTYGKELTESLRKAILNKKNAHECIYLSALVERLLMINRHDFFTIYAREKNREGIDYREHRLLETIHSFPDDLNEAMIQIMEEGAKIVKTDVSQAFYCLSLNKGGLTVAVLQYILGIKNYLKDSNRIEQDGMFTLDTKYLDFDYADFLIVKRYLSSFLEETPDGKIVFSHPLYREAFFEVAKYDGFLIAASIITHRDNYAFDDSFIPLIPLYQMLKDYSALAGMFKDRFLHFSDPTTWSEAESLAVLSLTSNTSDCFLDAFLKDTLEYGISVYGSENINRISMIEYDQNEDDEFVFLANILLSVYGFDNSSFICPPFFKSFIEDLVKNQELTSSIALLFVVAITLFANDKNTKLIKDSLPLLKLIIKKTKFKLHELAIAAYLKVAEALDIVKIDHDYIASLVSDGDALSQDIAFQNYCNIYRLLMPIDKETSYGPNIILYYASIAGTICRLDKINDFTFKGITMRSYSNLYFFVHDTILSSYIRFWAQYLKCYRIDIDFTDNLVDFYEINRKATIAMRHSYDVPLLKASLELSKTYIEVYHRSFQNIDTHDRTVKHHGEFKNHIAIVNHLSRALYPDKDGFMSKEALINKMKNSAYLIMDDGSLPSVSDYEEIINAVNEYNDIDVTDGFLFLSYALDVHYILTGESDDLSPIMEYLQLLISEKNIDYDLVIFVCDTLHHLYPEEDAFNCFQLYLQLFQQGYYSNYQYNIQTLNYLTKLYEAMDNKDRMSNLELLKEKGNARIYYINLLSNVFLAALADFDLTTNYRKLFLANQVLSDLVNNLNLPSDEENNLLHKLADEYFKRDMFSFTVELINGKKPLEICENVLKNCPLEKQNIYGKYQMCCFFEAMLNYEKDFENKVSIAGIYNLTLKSALKNHPANHIIIGKAITLHRYTKRLFEKNEIELNLNDIILDRWYFLSAGLVVLPRNDKLLFELIDDVKYYSIRKYTKKQIPQLLTIFQQASLFFDGCEKLTPPGYNAAIYILYHYYIFGKMYPRDYDYTDAYEKVVNYYKSARKQHIRLNKTSYSCLRELYFCDNDVLIRSFKSKKRALETIDRLMMKYQPYINVFPEIFFIKK